MLDPDANLPDDPGVLDREGFDDDWELAIGRDHNGPSHEQLLAALAKVRERGVVNLDRLLTNFEELLAPLLYIAEMIGTGGSDADRIEDVLERAIQHLGDKSADAMLALLGLTEATRGLRATQRRQTAAESYKSEEYFRTHLEKELLMAVAIQLRFELERELLDRQEQLLQSRGRLLWKLQASILEDGEIELFPRPLSKGGLSLSPISVLRRGVPIGEWIGGHLRAARSAPAD